LDSQATKVDRYMPDSGAQHFVQLLVANAAARAAAAVPSVLSLSQAAFLFQS
jgi:hypothetical protein